MQISDLAFRRNVLVQALIIMEFLLSLSPKAKEKLSAVKAPNKSVTYSDQQLSEEDTRWATDMKNAIVEYLRQGTEGPYFNRMVETVLARDKNWVRWKIENCPTIELPTMSPDMFVESRTAVTKLATTKRLRAMPLGSLSLDFLGDEDEEAGMEKLKDPERYSLPELSILRRGIADDDFEIEMPTNDESKASAIEGKASKSWKALRIASKSKLVVFDKIENDDKIDLVFEEKPAAEEAEAVEEAADGDVVFPEDRRAVVIVDATSSPGSRSDLVVQLVAQHSRVFTRVPRHVTRKPQEGEVDGQDCHFVDVQAFNVMRDGDLFLEFSEEGEDVHGTNRRVVEGIMDNDRVPVMEMDRDVSVHPLDRFRYVPRLTESPQGAQQVKDNGFDARFILVEAGEAAAAADAEAKPSDLFSLIASDIKSLESAIFGSESEPVAATGDGDVSMENGVAS
jgi:THO complex subunit 1